VEETDSISWRSRRTQPLPRGPAAAATVETKALEGERPKEAKDQESQGDEPVGETRRGVVPTGNGLKPLKRGRGGLNPTLGKGCQSSDSQP
jgi:hypothetical protein